MGIADPSPEMEYWMRPHLPYFLMKKSELFFVYADAPNMPYHMM